MLFDELDLTLDDFREIEHIESQFRETESHSSDYEEFIRFPNRRARKRCIVPSDTEDEETLVPSPSESGYTPNTEWHEPQGKQPNIIPYTEISGLKPMHLRHALAGGQPADFYNLMVPEALLEDTARQTNIFAAQVLSKSRLSRQSRLHLWKNTDKTEIKKFFGLIIWMGLVKLPKLALYWSNNPMYAQPFAKNIMSRNRFEILLRMLHFSNNEEARENDRLWKISNLLSTLNANFAYHYTPGEFLCVDESMIPFRGRVIFRQYNKQKRHKYGIKLFKLCTVPGYTWKIEVYSGKQLDSAFSTPTNVVLRLCEGLLGKGHSVFVDNWYTSLDLAEKLIDNETHLIGTLRRNRKYLPKQVMEAKLNPGEFAAKENSKGITVMKWKDKRDVCLLSTKHSIGFRKTKNKRGIEVIKPKIIMDYNKAKAAVDLSDQMTAYSSPLRKSIKWYKKLALELLLNTAVVNARVLYEATTKKKIPIIEFRRKLSQQMIDTNPRDGATSNIPCRPKRIKHSLVKAGGKAAKTRKFCVGCYKNNSQTHGRKIAKNKTKKVTTFCSVCPDKPYLCRSCFDKNH